MPDTDTSHTRRLQSSDRACFAGKGGLGSTKFVAFEALAWHNECFFCAQCKVSMVGKGFIQEGDHIICPECARNNIDVEAE